MSSAPPIPRSFSLKWDILYIRHLGHLKCCTMAGGDSIHLKRKSWHTEGNKPVFTRLFYSRFYRIVPLGENADWQVPVRNLPSQLPDRMASGAGTEQERGKHGKAGMGVGGHYRSCTPGTNADRLPGFVGCYLRHGPDHRRQEPGSRIVLDILGQPLQHRHCNSGQPDEWFSKTSLSLDPF